jgi:hypothetical protein
MKFKRGQSGNPKGKPKGAVNQLTRTVKEVVLDTFNILQSDPKTNLIAFAHKHPRDFYAIAAKLIPTEVKSNLDVKIINVIPPNKKVE